MTKFYIKCLIAFAFIVVCNLVSAFFADEKTDPVYLKFTALKQRSLIVGSSRAAQGIHPDVIHQSLTPSGLDLPIYNFAFALGVSPYGPVYIEKIHKMIKTDTENGLFILEVNPFLLCSECEEVNEPSAFKETTTYFGKTKALNQNPNFEYLLKKYNYSLGFLVKDKLFFDQFKTYYVSSSGRWVTADINDEKKPALYDKHIDYYKEKILPVYSFSRARLGYLNTLVKSLKKKGHVFIVRMPISIELQKLEDKNYPEFNNLMNELAKRNGVTYFGIDSFQGNYTHNDGDHLDSSSGKLFTEELSRKIKSRIRRE